MKRFKFLRDLDGVTLGDVRELDPTEAQPLIDAGTVVETDKPVTPVAVKEVVAIEPITGSGMKKAAAPAKAA